MSTSRSQRPRVFKFEGKPELGLGVLLLDLEGKQTIGFENGERRVFKNAAALVEVHDLDPDALAAVDAKVRGRSAARTGGARKAGTKAKATSSKKGIAAFPSFEAQVQWFEKKFPGGFLGEAFTLDERGDEGQTSAKKGYKAAAMKLAREELSAERFQSASAEELFASALKLLGKTNIAFPQEGTIRFAKIAEEKRPMILEALRAVLHGDGEYGPRLEKLAESINLVDQDGKPKVTTWPVATQFGALFDPATHVCVKPTFFGGQGLLLGMDFDVSTPVTAGKYDKLLAIARETEARLRKLGHEPRDLMDVYSFIYRTHEGTRSAKGEAPPAQA